MKIMILGGHGFIGSNLKRILSGQEYDFIDFSRSNGYDLRNFEKSKDVFFNFNPDVIYHLASHGGSLHYVTEFAADVISDNITMSLNLYNIVKDLPNTKIINVISNCSYPGNTQIQKESEWLSGPVHDSVFSFANSKRILYYISKCYYKQHKVKSVNLIISNAFGINDHVDPNKTHALDGMIIRIIKAKREGNRKFEVWGSGKPIREWIYVEDICNILMIVLDKDTIIEPINVAQNKGYSIRESVEIIKRLSGYSGDIVFNTKYQDGDAIKILDDSRFKDYFGEYIFVDHEEALKRTIKFYEEAL